MRKKNLIHLGYGVTVRIGMFPFQTPLGAHPGLGTQPRYEALGRTWVEIINTQ